MLNFIRVASYLIIEHCIVLRRILYRQTEFELSVII